MRLRVLPNVILILLVVVLFVVNLGVYGGFVQGESAGTGSEIRDARQQALTAAQRAAADDSDKLPGEYVPPQGIQHTGPYPLEEPVPFCPEHEVSPNCYASNPPTSGLHLPVQQMVQLPDGTLMNIPPDPGIFNVAVPREAIPHIEEHAGVYIGYNCATAVCNEVVRRLHTVVEEALSQGKRVVMSPDPDLDAETIGLASWTRFDVFGIGNFSEQRVRRFIEVHSCRYDPEGFCN